MARAVTTVRGHEKVPTDITQDGQAVVITAVAVEQAL
ncbi:MAG: hypothetical protein JWP83_4357 [Mycobacterium sp.]|jgi:hypothetical protein|nr:hypothetical protein [Mycobacterium sp.]